MPYRINPSITAISLVLLGLSACQPAQVNDGSSGTDPVADIVPVETTAIEIETTVAEPAAQAQADEVRDAHDPDEHDHDEHDHSEHDHDEHDHDAHDHEGHDHDTAGGEAHVHGHADLAVTVDGDSIQVSLISPLANFGLSESNPDIDDLSSYGASIVEFIGGDCSQSDSDIRVEADGQHGNMNIELSYTCADVSAVEAAHFIMFDVYPGFEEVDAVILTEDDQLALELTPSAHTLTFP